MRQLGIAAWLCSLALLAGCATTQNTLAQNLAWERVRSCAHFASVDVERVEPDGRVWVSYRVTGEYRLWTDCMIEAARKQGRGTGSVPSIVTSTAPVTGPSDVFPASAPVWKPGFEWAYRYDSPSGSGTYVWAVDREELVGGARHWVVKTGTRNLFYRAEDLATSHETVEGVVVVKYDPPRLHFKWPLTPGLTWDQASRTERPQDRTTADRHHVWTVESQEPVTVPAGVFQCVKIVERNKRTGTVVNELWYSPAVTNWVKLREVLSNGERHRELIAYKVSG
jgi:hypothetical protein